MASSRMAGAVESEEIVPKKSLFDDNESSSEDDQEEGGATLGLNQEFARRFEYNKKREERARLEEKLKSRKGDDEDSESSEDEDDDGYLATKQLDDEISAVLSAIKKKDPRIYDKDAVFYKPVDEAAATKPKQEKSMTIKDYHRERYLKGDIGAEEEEEAKPEIHLPFAHQQAQLKRDLLAAADEDDDSEEWSDDDAFLKPKEKPTKVEPLADEDGVHPSRAAAMKFTEDDVVNADKNPDEYLTKFMAARAWAPESGLNWQPFDSDDEEEEAKADEFEHAYNMRFEDPDKSNEVLKTYSRSLTAARSVRKEELTGRKKQRQLEKERKEAEQRQLEEDRARLRRLKVDEASDKLAKIKAAAGASGKALADEDWLKFLDDNWDDDNWEEEMKKRFGEEYYAQSDDDFSAGEPGSMGKKPSWDDDIDINDIIPDFDDQEKANISLSDLEDEPMEDVKDEADAGEDNSDDDNRPAKKRKTTKDFKNEKIEKKRQARQEHAKLTALVDSKMALENPRALASSSKSTSGPGFRYRETSPMAFGMTARDILLAPSDAALNEFAGLKKLASFRDADKKRKDKKRLGKKARLREWRRETFGKEYEHTGPTYGFEKMAAEDEQQSGPSRDKRVSFSKSIKSAPKEDGGNVVEGERKKKRKRSKGKKSDAKAEEGVEA